MVNERIEVNERIVDKSRDPRRRELIETIYYVIENCLEGRRSEREREMGGWKGEGERE